MRSTRIAFAALICALFAATGVLADGGRLTLGADCGVYYPVFAHNRQDTFTTSAAPIYGGHVAYGVSDHTEIRAGGLYTIQEVEIDDGEKVTMSLQDILLGVRWSILTGSIRPLAYLGASYYIINLEQPLQDESDFGIHVGTGMEFVLTKNLRLGVNGFGEYVLPHRFKSAFGLSALAFVNLTF